MIYILKYRIAQIFFCIFNFLIPCSYLIKNQNTKLGYSRISILYKKKYYKLCNAKSFTAHLIPLGAFNEDIQSSIPPIPNYSYKSCNMFTR